MSLSSQRLGMALRSQRLPSWASFSSSVISARSRSTRSLTGRAASFQEDVCSPGSVGGGVVTTTLLKGDERISPEAFEKLGTDRDNVLTRTTPALRTPRDGTSFEKFGHWLIT
jgi:hypothetical protein